MFLIFTLINELFFKIVKNCKNFLPSKKIKKIFLKNKSIVKNLFRRTSVFFLIALCLIFILNNYMLLKAQIKDKIIRIILLIKNNCFFKKDINIHSKNINK